MYTSCSLDSRIPFAFCFDNIPRIHAVSLGGLQEYSVVRTLGLSVLKCVEYGSTHVTLP